MADTKKTKNDWETIIRLGSSSIAHVLASAMPFGNLREELIEEILFQSIQGSSSILAELREKLVTTPSEVQENYSNRVKIAGEHLQLAGSILTELQKNLDQQRQQLVDIQTDLEKHKQDAEYWKKLADINKDSAAVLTSEIERAMRQQIRKELDRGKTLRTIGGFIGWVITLIVGGIVGAAIQQIWQSGKLF